MFKALVALMIIVPAIEIWGVITVGKIIGAWETVALLLLTGFVGAFIARREARRVWEYAQVQLRQGQIPGDSIVEGICIFAGGVLLMSPGFFTDIVGFLLVFPLTRPFFKALVLAYIRKKIANGQVHMFKRW
ncbi:FxsA family protein [Paenibacillus thalictri]|uniref:Membrane protein FxsA n=1 Tax=Paenibacillus thalictri TaxID=2527873 RepID=A0A4Q9DMT6_9BACL|nr:FxsA family protein [Paenibacillus thalictri]TBL75050.1 membrane protein FxsA [Paenibacillus thalictri]